MGLRVTDEKMINIVESVMTEFNKEIVDALNKKSCKAKSITIKKNNIIYVEQENKELGFVFQFHHLLPDFTAFENVLIPNQISGEDGDKSKATELLNYIGLKDRFNHLPSQLSGGEKLRVSVVRALMNDPKLVLADEPTGNLDVGNAIKLVDLFKKINKDFVIDVITIYKRSSNILNNEKQDVSKFVGSADPGLFKNEFEKILYKI